MTHPTIHPNGTPAALLAATYEHAHDALTEAMDVMRGTAPNPRDYEGPEAYDRAFAEHAQRMQRVAAVRCEFDTLIGHCEGVTS
jgi:hypothetical protein